MPTFSCPGSGEGTLTARFPRATSEWRTAWTGLVGGSGCISSAMAWLQRESATATSTTIGSSPDPEHAPALGGLKSMALAQKFPSVAQTNVRSCYTVHMPTRDRPLSSLPSSSTTARIQITPAELWDLYYRDEMSYAVISRHLGCSRAYVSKLMRAYGILPRDKGAALRVGKRHGRSTGPEPQPWTTERLEARSEAATASVRRWRQRNPEKVRAQWRLNKAVQRGTVARPQGCDRCRKDCTPHGHHHDYEKPFEVEWLCPKCHHGEHRKERLVALAHDRYVS